jgi:hypothetical protein
MYVLALHICSGSPVTCENLIKYAVPIDDRLVVDSPATTAGARITQEIPNTYPGFGAALVPQQSVLMRFENFGPVRTARDRI